MHPLVVLFAFRRDAITSNSPDVARIAPPPPVSVAVTRSGSTAAGRAVARGCPKAATPAFAGAGDDCELAVASIVAASGQALVGVVGPLIEVPALIGRAMSPWPPAASACSAGSRASRQGFLDAVIA
jgi:ACR3 family arsenite transporter